MGKHTRTKKLRTEVTSGRYNFPLTSSGRRQTYAIVHNSVSGRYDVTSGKLDKPAAAIGEGPKRIEKDYDREEIADAVVDAFSFVNKYVDLKHAGEPGFTHMGGSRHVMLSVDLASADMSTLTMDDFINGFIDRCNGALSDLGVEAGTLAMHTSLRKTLPLFSIYVTLPAA